MWLLRAIAKQRLKDFPGAVADLDEAKIHPHDKRRGSNHEVLAARLSVVTSTSTRQKEMHGRLVWWEGYEKDIFFERQLGLWRIWVLSFLCIGEDIWYYPFFVRNFIWTLTRLNLWVAKCIRLGSVEHRFVWSKAGVVLPAKPKKIPHLYTLFICCCWNPSMLHTVGPGGHSHSHHSDHGFRTWHLGARNSGIFTGHYEHLIAECNEACWSIASLVTL